MLHLFQTINHGDASLARWGLFSEFSWESENGRGTSIGGGRR
jgi:hypothetical protein